MTVRLLLDTHALLWWWTDDPQAELEGLVLVTRDLILGVFAVSTNGTDLRL